MDWTAQEPAEVVSIFREQVNLGQEGALLVGVPVPERAGVPYEATMAAIDDALLTAKERGIKGKALTPFVLEEIKNRSSGKSLEANLALIRNNARIGAEIARCLAG